MPPAPAVSGAARLADKTLTWVNRQPSAPLRHGPVIVRRIGAAGLSAGETRKWLTSHPSRQPPGRFGIAVLASILTAGTDGCR